MVSSIKGLGVDFKSEALRENLKRVSSKVEPTNQKIADSVNLSTSRPEIRVATLLTELSQLISARDENDLKGIKEKLGSIRQTFGEDIAAELERSLSRIDEVGSQALAEFKTNIEQMLIIEENRQSAKSKLSDLESATSAVEDLRLKLGSKDAALIATLGDIDPTSLE